MDLSWDDYISESSASNMMNTPRTPPKSPKSHHSSRSKLSSLLEYLDSAEGRAASPKKRVGSPSRSPGRLKATENNVDVSYDLDDDVSALSFSVSKDSGQTRTSKRGGYIWDEWDNGGGAENSTHSQTSSVDEPTYFSVRPSGSRSTVLGSDDPAQAVSGAYGGVEGGGSHSTEATLETTIMDLRDKAMNMKAELKSKNAQVKTMQSDYQRLVIAKNRKIQRARSKWSEKLRAEQDEHAAVMTQQREFVAKVTSDTAALETKMRDLEERLEASVKSEKVETSATEQEMERMLVRARRQWELNEQAYFRKVLAEKTDQLQQEVTGSFEPRLAKFVERGRAALRTRSAELEKKLDETRRRLQTELHGELDARLQELRDQLKEEEQKSRKAGEVDLQKCLGRHNDEVNALKERFAREKRQVDESAERLRRLEAESTLAGMKTIRKAEKVKIEELAARHARALSEAVSSLSTQREARRAELDAETEAWGDHFRGRLANENAVKTARLQAQARTDALASGETVLARVREELRKEADANAIQLSSTLADRRAHHEQALERLREDELRAQNELEAVEQDLRYLRLERDAARRQGEALVNEEAEGERSVEALRAELRTVQGQLSQLDTQHSSEKATRMDALRGELREWKERYMAVREQEVKTGHRTHEAMEALRDRLREETSRITDKVSAVLRSKEMVVRDLQRQLGDLQRQNAQSQEDLEMRRDRKFSVMEAAL